MLDNRVTALYISDMFFLLSQHCVATIPLNSHSEFRLFPRAGLNNAIGPKWSKAKETRDNRGDLKSVIVKGRNSDA